MKTVALVVADPCRGRLGHARGLDDPWGGSTVLGATLQRVTAAPGLDATAVVARDAAELPERCLSEAQRIGADVIAVGASFDNENEAAVRRVRRAWTLDGWRGGLGGATIWDELLPALPLASVAAELDADVVLLVGGDWPLVDPEISQEMLAVHRAAPDAMKLCFSQAPPGLSGVVVARSLLQDMADAEGGFADVLAYQPKRPAVDPIALEFNVPVPASVRDTARRFVYDTPESVVRLNALYKSLGRGWIEAGAAEITDAARTCELEQAGSVGVFLPPQIVIELTPRRRATGPITPQYHAKLDRADLTDALLERLLPDLRGLTVTLGGLGEPLLHGRWPEVVQRVREAGAISVALETDLIPADERSPAELAKAVIAAAPDAVLIRLNAEDAEVYRQEMGVNRFADVMATIQALFERRGVVPGRHAVPAIVPMLTKTDVTTPQLETFFERWWQLARHAVIQRFPTAGCGGYALAPDRNPVPMEGPWRPPSPHQRKQRLTVWSDGTVALCHQDWLGRAALGNLRDASLRELWHRLPELAPDSAWSPDDSPLCRRCFDYASLHAMNAEACGV